MSFMSFCSIHAMSDPRTDPSMTYNYQESYEMLHPNQHGRHKSVSSDASDQEDSHDSHDSHDFHDSHESSEHQESHTEPSTEMSMRLFIVLSVFSALVVAINILQVALLRKIDNLWWINVPPAIIFIFTGVIILQYFILRKSRVSTAWGEANGARKTAWVGVVLSVVIPPVLCQFVYLNTSAIPDFREKVWHMSFLYQEILIPPALLIIQFDAYNNSIQAGFNGTGKCHITNGNQDCGDHMTWDAQATVNDTQMRYHIFKPGNITLRSRDSISIQFEATWDSRHTSTPNLIEPYLYYVFVDPSIITDSLQLEAINCNLYEFQWVPPLGTNYLSLQKTIIADEVDALHMQHKCDIPWKLYSTRGTYNPTVNHFGMLNVSACDVAGTGWAGETCSSLNYLMFTSDLVVKRKSGHGTSWKKIIIDEGSIAGGVMFFTWFLGLYAL